MRNNWRSILTWQRGNFPVYAVYVLCFLCLVWSAESWVPMRSLHLVALFFTAAFWGQLARNLQQWSPQQIYCDLPFFPEHVHNLFLRLTRAWFSTQAKWHQTPQIPAGTRAIQVTLSFHEQPRVVQRGNAGAASQHIKATGAVYQTWFVR